MFTLLILDDISMPKLWRIPDFGTSKRRIKEGLKLKLLTD